MRPSTPPAALLAALALAAIPLGARAEDGPAAAATKPPACAERFSPDEDPIDVVVRCEKAVAAAGPRDRGASLVALAKLYGSLERALCGACGYAPRVGERCDAFLAFAEAAEGAFRRRESGAGFEYIGRELASAAQAALTPAEAEQARGLAPSLAAVPVPAECAYPAPGTECEVTLGPDPVRSVRRCLASLQPKETNPGKLLRAGYLCTALVHACREPSASCAGAERLFEDFPDVFPEVYPYDPAKSASAPRRYRGRFEAEVMRRWPETPGAGDALWAVALTDSGVAPGPCPRSVPDVKQDELVAIALGCDGSAYAVEGPARAPYLLAAGRLFGALGATGTWGLGSAYDGLLRVRENLDFVKDSVDGWRYTGRHYRWILERFPSSPEADDADWALANAPRRGACEGSFAACELAPVLPVATYAATRPSGKYAESAVARTNQRLAAVVERLRSGTGTAEPDVDRPVLEQYAALARGFPAAHRGATDHLLGAWRTWLDGAARARAKQRAR